MSGNLCHWGGGRTPNGKCHLKFPFWFSAHLPNTILAIIRLVYINIYILALRAKKGSIILKAKLATGLTYKLDHQIRKSNMGTVLQSKTQSSDLKMRSGHRSNAAARACQPWGKLRAPTMWGGRRTSPAENMIVRRRRRRIWWWWW